MEFIRKDETKGSLKKEESKIHVGVGKVTDNTDQKIKVEAEKLKKKSKQT